MNNIYDIYEGIMDRKNRQTVGSNVTDQLYGELPKKYSYSGKRRYYMECEYGLKALKNYDMLLSFSDVNNPKGIMVYTAYSGWSQEYEIDVYVVDEQFLKNNLGGGICLLGTITIPDTKINWDESKSNDICYDVLLRVRYNFEEFMNYLIEYKRDRRNRKPSTFTSEDNHKSKLVYDDIKKKFPKTR